MGAFIAKFTARPIRFATLRTGNFQFSPTLIAELGACLILTLAIWALHY